jgi:hypothetical protein
MDRIIAAAALLLLTGAAALPATAETGAPAQRPDAEPRSYLSPTDETELAPRTPPVTHPKPMERTRMGVPAVSSPANRAAPAVRVDPPAKPLAQPRRAAPARKIVQRRTMTPRRSVRVPQQPDTRLSTIFTQPRSDANPPPGTLAPQSGARTFDPGARRAMTYNYAPAPPATFDGAPCPTRSRASLGELFACTR